MILQNLLIVVKAQSLIEKTQTLIQKKKKKIDDLIRERSNRRK